MRAERKPNAFGKDSGTQRNAICRRNLKRRTPQKHLRKQHNEAIMGLFTAPFYKIYKEGIMLIPINKIRINEGRRELSPAGIDKLVESMAVVGLLNPISVDESNRLIAGNHRLEAAKRLGWTEIECSVRKLDGL